MTWLHNPVLTALGWTLLHSLWQLSVLAVIASLLFAALHRASSHVRYLVSYFTYLATLPTLLITFFVVYPPPLTVTTPSGLPVHATTLPSISVPALLLSFPTNPSTPTLTQHATAFLSPALPYAALLYLFIATFLALRLLVGYLLLRRTRTSATAAPQLEPLLAQLRTRLHLRTPVLLRLSPRVEVPTVLGAFRPVILLPLSAITGLSSDHLTHLLLHELAHVRRHDYLANLLQSVVDTLLFYHPAARWLSARIRQEREHCCDDLAAAVTGNRKAYADALASMETLREFLPPASARFALSARGGSLLRRIHHILEIPMPKSIAQRIITTTSLALTATALTLAIYTVGCTRTSGGSSPPMTDRHTTADPSYARADTVSDARTQSLHPAANDRHLPTMIVSIDSNSPETHTLEGMLNHLASTYKLNIVPNWQVIESAGVDRKAPVGVNLHDVPFDKALTTILASIDSNRPLAAEMDENVIVISTAEALEKAAGVVVHAYDIRDLLIQPSSPPPALPANVEPPLPPSPEQLRAEIVNKLTDAIKSTIEPSSWRDNGGSSGSIQEFEGQLLIIQTPKNQAAIDNLLTVLRRAHNLEISVESRIFIVDDALYAGLKLAPVANGHGTATFLTDPQLEAFLKVIAKSPTVVDLARPRITLFSGQTGRIDVAPALTYSGIKLDIEVAASADRASVVANLRCALVERTDTQPASTSPPSLTETQASTALLAIPDHMTIVVGTDLESEAMHAHHQHFVYLLRPAIIDLK